MNELPVPCACTASGGEQLSWRWDSKGGHQNLGPLTATSLCVCVSAEGHLWRPIILDTWKSAIFIM